MSTSQSGIMDQANRKVALMNAIIHQSADDVIDRYGDSAITLLTDRIDQMMDDGMSRDVDRAYLLLNEVERILAHEA